MCVCAAGFCICYLGDGTGSWMWHRRRSRNLMRRMQERCHLYGSGRQASVKKEDAVSGKRVKENESGSNFLDRIVSWWDSYKDFDDLKEVLDRITVGGIPTWISTNWRQAVQPQVQSDKTADVIKSRVHGAILLVFGRLPKKYWPAQHQALKMARNHILVPRDEW